MRDLVLVLLVASIILFAGCISVDIQQKVEKDGSSTITQKLDMTGLLAYAKSMSNGSSSTDMDKSMSEICVNVTKKDSTVICKTEGGVVTMTKKVTAADAGYEFSTGSRFPYTVYTFKTETMPQASSDSGIMGSAGGAISSKSSKFTDAAMKSSAMMLKAANAKISYTIEMPGTITVAKNGEIVDGKASYNVLTLMENGEAVEVESQELDMVAVAIIVVVVLAIVGIGAFFLFGKKDKMAPKQPVAE